MRKSARILAGVPPRTTTRSASKTASSMLCVTRNMLRVGIFLASHSSMSSPRRFSAVSTSSAENGSSMKRTSGSTARARREAHALLHSPREFLGKCVFEVRETHGRKGLKRAKVAFLVRHSAGQQRCFHIFSSTVVATEIERSSENTMETFGRQSAIRVPCHSTLRHPKARSQAGKHPQHGGLAAPVGGTQQRKDRVLFEGQVDRRNHLNLVAVGLCVFFLDLARFEDRSNARRGWHRCDGPGGEEEFPAPELSSLWAGPSASLVKGFHQALPRFFRDLVKELIAFGGIHRIHDGFHLMGRTRIQKHVGVKIGNSGEEHCGEIGRYLAKQVALHVKRHAQHSLCGLRGPIFAQKIDCGFPLGMSDEFAERI